MFHPLILDYLCLLEGQLHTNKPMYLINWFVLLHHSLAAIAVRLSPNILIYASGILSFAVFSTKSNKQSCIFFGRDYFTGKDHIESNRKLRYPTAHFSLTYKKLTIKVCGKVWVRF